MSTNTDAGTTAATHPTTGPAAEREDINHASLPDAELHSLSRFTRRSLEGIRVTDATTVSSLRSIEYEYRNSAAISRRAVISDVPSKSAEIVQQTALEICQIVEEAEAAIRNKVAQLRRRTDQFTSAVKTHADPHWYRKIRLGSGELSRVGSSQERDVLWHLLLNMPIKDFADFCAFLKEEFQPSIVTSWPHQRQFIRLLLMRVAEESKKNAGYADALSLFVHVRANLLVEKNEKKRREKYELYEAERQYVDDTIFWLLGHHSDADVYWNFASHWRSLVYTGDYAKIEHLMAILEPIKEKARQEIRHKALLAADGRLPTELVDGIYEAALLVEEVPLEG